MIFSSGRAGASVAVLLLLWSLAGEPPKLISTDVTQSLPCLQKVLYIARQKSKRLFSFFLRQISLDLVSSISVKKMKNYEDAPCDVCRSKESEPSNEMIFCDTCDVCVHQACYGVSEIPKGQWFCKPCEQNLKPKCIFCPSGKGAMKKTKNGNWAHVSCALWIPEVSFGNPEKMDNIVNTEKIPKSRWSLVCSLCHVRGGACIQCYVKTCRTAYHVTCAFNFKLYMEMEDVIDSEHEIKFESFCLAHTEIHASGQNPHVSSGSSKKRKKTQENPKSDENETLTRKLEIKAPLQEENRAETKAPLQEENRASTSRNSTIPIVSTVETNIEGGTNNVQNVGDVNQMGARVFTEQEAVNLAAISKGTARKSFALPPKNIKTLSQIIPKRNGKVARDTKGQSSDKSKKPSVQNKPSKPKKSKPKSSLERTKPLKHPNHPTQFASHEQEKSTAGTEQPSSTEPGISYKQSFSSSSHTVNNSHQLFPPSDTLTSAAVQIEHQNILKDSGTPQKETDSNPINDFTPCASNVRQFSSPSTNQNGQWPVSDVAVAFSANRTSSAMPKNDSFDNFSRYVTSLLRTLPFKKSLKVQKKIISLILKEHDVSSEEEYDVSSLSSDE